MIGGNMQEKKSAFDYEFNEVFLVFKDYCKKFFFILIVVILRRSVDVAFELISGKVVIPIIFFILASRIQLSGMDGTLNSIIQLSVGLTGSAGVLFYKLKKDTKETKTTKALISFLYQNIINLI